jgi:nickel transport protein
MKVRRILPFMLLGILALPGKALAHAVQTNYLLSNQLELQSTFSTGAPLKGAKVTVYAPNNPHRPWLQGVTDAQGRFAFLPDTAIEGNWEVTIRQQGHGDILTVPVGQDGVEFDLISQAASSDTHYSAFPMLWLGTLLIALATGGTRVFKRANPQ